MSNVLKMVEEALVNLHSFAAPHNRVTDEPWAQMEYDYTAALTAIRGLEWKPLSEAPCGSLRGYVLGMYEQGAWQKYLPSSLERGDALALGWTHFCRPILPAPPKREVENAG